MSNKPIILLDESTSLLDKDTEFKILAQMNDIFIDKLVILVSHKNVFPFNYNEKICLQENERS